MKEIDRPEERMVLLAVIFVLLGALTPSKGFYYLAVVVAVAFVYRRMASVASASFRLYLSFRLQQSDPTAQDIINVGILCASSYLGCLAFHLTGELKNMVMERANQPLFQGLNQHERSIVVASIFTLACAEFGKPWSRWVCYRGDNNVGFLGPLDYQLYSINDKIAACIDMDDRQSTALLGAVQIMYFQNLSLCNEDAWTTMFYEFNHPIIERNDWDGYYITFLHILLACGNNQGAMEAIKEEETPRYLLIMATYPPYHNCNLEFVFFALRYWYVLLRQKIESIVGTVLIYLGLDTVVSMVVDGWDTTSS